MPTWTSNIPSQVKTYANTGAFPVTGSVKTIYIAEDTDIAYYWTGSAYQAISIQDLSGLVPYTGATNDVDLGNNDLNAEGIKIKGTAGNGHLNMKHQSSNPTAGGSESVLYADNSGNPKWKNDGNAVQDVLLSGTTTASISDSTNKRYVTDAQLTVLGNTSGTNTGDETQASILSKLGFYRYLNVTPSTVHTGTTIETQIEMITIPANTFKNTSDVFDFLIQARRPSGSGSGAFTFRFRLGTTNVMSSATILALSIPGSTAVYAPLVRSGSINSGTLLIFSRASNLTNDLTATGVSPATTTSLSFDFTTTLYAFVSIELSNSSDSVQITRVQLKNF